MNCHRGTEEGCDTIIGDEAASMDFLGNIVCGGPVLSNTERADSDDGWALQASVVYV